jgi:protein-S-isoprenylcysteine O-methyltransferase Ste14
MFRRRFADFLLFCVTLTELVILFLLTPTFTITDWIYVLQHLIVLGIALTRYQPKVRDYSVASSIAVGTAYLYPYAQVVYLRWSPGHVASPTAGLVLVTLAAGLSLVSLLTMGKRFGVRPALRGVVTRGPYRFVRHPMYLSYVLADIGYNLQEWNFVTLLLVVGGWMSLIYRIHAEERVLGQHAKWLAYVHLVRYRLFPGLW